MSSGEHLKFFPNENGTIIDLSYNDYAKVKIGIQDGAGQVETENILLKNNLDVVDSAAITGLFKIVQKKQEYNPQEDTKFQENFKNGRYGRVDIDFSTDLGDYPKGYYPVAIVGVTTGHSHVGKIAGFQIINNTDTSCTAAIYITFNGYKKSTDVKAATMKVKVLFLRKSTDHLSNLDGGSMWDEGETNGSDDSGFDSEVGKLQDSIDGLDGRINGLGSSIQDVQDQVNNMNKPAEDSGSSGDKGGKK